MIDEWIKLCAKSNTGVPTQVCLICGQVFIVLCYGLDFQHYRYPEGTFFGRSWHLVVAKNHVSPLFHLIKKKLGKTAQKKTSWKGWQSCRQCQWFLRSRPGKEAWSTQRHFSGEIDQGTIGRAWTCLSRASHTLHTFPPALILQPITYLPQALPLLRFQSPCKVQPVQRPLQLQNESLLFWTS